MCFSLALFFLVAVVVVTAKFHFILFLCFDLYALKRAGIPFSSSSLPLLLAPFVQREREGGRGENIYFILYYIISYLSYKQIEENQQINRAL